ncbi:MAG: hypothetical protein U5L96_12290 [Owenweeksia sp.]|nr:hypothetical protein [Owenweeksia sp.]
MAIITKVHARQILDSRGNPTVECDVITDIGHTSRQQCLVELLPVCMKPWSCAMVTPIAYLGKGVLQAVANINEAIAEEITGIDVSNQVGIDQLMLQLDGTENKANLGANAMLAVSLAAAKAAAGNHGQSLFHYIGGVNARTMPVPMMNILNGGAC